MKKHILRFNKNNSASADSFYAIKDGSKRIETRAATERYRKFQAGDILVFELGGKGLEKEIEKVTIFKDLEGLLKHYPAKDIMPTLKTTAELREAYESYSGYKEKIKKFGIIAFELKNSPER